MSKIAKPLANGGGKTQIRSSCQLQMVLPKGNHANPLRILEPCRKRLTSLKAERILLVSEENIKKIQIVLILPEILQSLDRYAIIFGQELCLLFKEHEQLRRRYECAVELLKEGERLEKEYSEWLEMKEKQEALFSESSSENETEASQAEEEYVIRVRGQSMTTLRYNLVLVKQDLTNSVKVMLRRIRSDPTSANAILEQARRLTGAKKDFVTGLEELQSIVREKLLTTPVELEERKYYIGKVVQRENKILKIKDKLQADYNQQMKLKNEEEEKQTIVIDHLKEALHRLNETTSKDCSRLLDDATKRIEADVKHSDTKQSNFIQENGELKKVFTDKLRHNYEDEREKRKRKFKLSTEVFNWIQKYDADMGMRQDEYDDILIDRDSLRKDLDDLGRHFVALEKEYLDIVEERRLAEEAEEKRQQELEMRTTAAIQLQAAWRGYRVRKQLKKKDKKGKKNKGRKSK